jgi:hypothetical protein
VAHGMQICRRRRLRHACKEFPGKSCLECVCQLGFPAWSPWRSVWGTIGKPDQFAEAARKPQRAFRDLAATTPISSPPTAQKRF